MTTIPDQDFALITVDDLKTEFNIAATETAWDTRLRRLTRAVTSGIETYCCRKFIARTETLTFNGDGGDRLFVAPPIIIPPTPTITIDGTALVSTTDFFVEKDTGIIRLNGHTFTENISNVVVVLRHGYERAALPGSIEMAAILWAADLFKLLSDDRHGQGSISHGDESVAFTNEAIPGRVLAMIQPYRMVRFGGMTP